MVCNKCSKEANKKGVFGTNLYHNFTTMFHYGSKHDFEEWEFTLCEDCLLEFTNTFSIKPKSREYDFDEEIGTVGKEIF